jgi:hypothetical protein
LKFIEDVGILLHLARWDQPPFEMRWKLFVRL